MNKGTSSKTAGLVIVILIIIAGLWLMLRDPGTDANQQSESYTMTIPKPTKETDTASGAKSVQSSGSTNDSLTADSVTIDSELEAFSADNSSANEPVQ